MCTRQSWERVDVDVWAEDKTGRMRWRAQSVEGGMLEAEEAVVVTYYSAREAVACRVARHNGSGIG